MCAKRLIHIFLMVGKNWTTHLYFSICHPIVYVVCNFTYRNVSTHWSQYQRVKKVPIWNCHQITQPWLKYLRLGKQVTFVRQDDSSLPSHTLWSQKFCNKLTLYLDMHTEHHDWGLAAWTGVRSLKIMSELYHLSLSTNNFFKHSFKFTSRSVFQLKEFSLENRNLLRKSVLLTVFPQEETRSKFLADNFTPQKVPG